MFRFYSDFSARHFIMALGNDPEIEFLANHLLSLTVQNQKKSFVAKRWIIGIIGIPCSGKSVFAEHLSNTINALHSVRDGNRGKQEICAFIGMDGFHYRRSELDKMENPKMAHRMRGAHWTFDAVAFGRLLGRIQQDLDSEIVVPTFDHSVKDPVQNGKSIMKHHHIVIVEGLYLFLDEEPWKSKVSPYFNERWLLQCDWDLAEQRIIKRHVESGVTDNKQSALLRWNDNDKPNGQFLLKQLDRDRLHVVLRSLSSGQIQIERIDWSSKLRCKL